MAKRRITVTLDEDFVELARWLGAETLSSVVNEALAAHLERLARRAALRHLLDRWDAELGQVSAEAAAAARNAFDQLDCVYRRASL